MPSSESAFPYAVTTIDKLIAIVFILIALLLCVRYNIGLNQYFLANDAFATIGCNQFTITIKWVYSHNYVSGN